MTQTIRLGKFHTQEELRTCPSCQQEFWSRQDKNYKTCVSCWQRDPYRKWTNSKGTVYIHLPSDDLFYDDTINLGNILGSGWIREARYKMSQKLKRSLQDTEQVFHIDGNKSNNSLENLILIKKPSLYHINFSAEPENVGKQEDEI